jgi:hypothetical protein
MSQSLLLEKNPERKNDQVIVIEFLNMPEDRQAIHSQIPQFELIGDNKLVGVS